MDETATAPAAMDLDPRRARLAEWERRSSPYIIVAAILPLAGAFGEVQDSPSRAILGITCWLVFVVDLVVHLRLSDHYLRTRSGKIDLGIVILTAPYYLVFSGSGGALVTLARLARVARLARGVGRSDRLRHLMDQLGQVAIYAGGLLTACALIEKWVEPPSSGFATYGDAFWWGAVTLTTVGYGDLFPVTAVGRIVAVVLMLGGVAFLGTLAGTLSAFFGLANDGTSSATSYSESPEPVADDPVARELALLRAQVGELVARLDLPGTS